LIKLLNKIARWFARAPVLWAALLGMALVLPSLGVEEVLDDFKIKDTLTDYLAGLPGDGPWWEIGVIHDGNEATIQDKLARAKVPWWTWPRLKVSFTRPLVFPVHLLDHALWPGHLILMHLQSILWYGLACLLAGLLCRQVIGDRSVFLLAVFIYAMEDFHAVPVAWIANRSLVMAAAFGFLSLWAYIRWRRDDWTRGAWLSPLLLFVALLGAESGVCIFLYMLAYELSFARDPLRRRALCLVPALAAVMVWRVGYLLLGHGTAGSGFYIDPIHEPLEFLAMFPERLLQMLKWQFGVSWTFLNHLDAQVSWLDKPVGWIIPAIVGCGVAWLIACRARRDAEIRFWALGSMLALIPMATSSPSEKMGFISGLGASVLVAHLIVWIFRAWPGLPSARRALAGVVVVVAILAHLVQAPVYLFLSSHSVGRSLINMGFLPAKVLGNSPALEHQEIFVIHAPTCMHGMLIPHERERRGLVRPAKTWILGSGFEQTVEVRRVDKRTLDLFSEDGYLDDPLATFYRGLGHRFSPGDKVRLPNHMVIVSEVTTDGRPSRILVRFDTPLPHPDLHLITWDGEDYTWFKLPRVGQKILLQDGEQKNTIEDGQ